MAGTLFSSTINPLLIQLLSPLNGTMESPLRILESWNVVMEQIDLIYLQHSFLKSGRPQELNETMESPPKNLRP